MTIRLRAAAPHDLDAVVAVFLGCWRGTYDAWMPPAVVGSMTEDRAEGLWRQALTRPGWQVVVAEVDGRVCGQVAFSADTGDGDTGWVYSLYVDPSAQGAGVGSALIERAAARLTGLGCHQGRLWVFAANARSIRFYGDHGWHPDGCARVEEPYGENVIRLSKDLFKRARRPA